LRGVAVVTWVASQQEGEAAHSQKGP
jgi:hypothetical protein